MGSHNSQIEYFIRKLLSKDKMSFIQKYKVNNLGD